MTELGLQVCSHLSFRLIHCYGVIFMLETFFGAVFVGLVLFGLLALCYFIMLKMCLPKKKYPYYIVIPAKRCDSDVTAAAYAARMKMNCLGDEAYGSVLVLDCGMEEAQRLSCLNVCRETNGIYLCNLEEFADFIR